MSGPKIAMTEELAGHAREVRQATVMVLTRLAAHPGMSEGGKVAMKVACDALEVLDTQAETIAELRRQTQTIVAAYDQLKSSKTPNGLPVLELALADAINQARPV